MTRTARRLLGDIRELAPDIVSRMKEIEAGRRIPTDLIEAMRSIGIFRIFMPRSHGGLELELPAALKIIEALARIDGSVGWTAMIGIGNGLFASLLPRKTYDQIYQGNPDRIIAGSAQPVGRAEAVADGWRINGRWPFASGCQHADWMFGFCLITGSGKSLSEAATKEGLPLVRGVFLPARDWQIEDSWYAAGLKGTGSHHITLRDKIVSAANFFDPVAGMPCLSGPLYQAVRQLLPLLHGAVSVGIAEGALDEIIELAKTGRQQHHAAVPMRESEIFQSELGRIGAEVKAARAFLQIQAANHWRHALAGTLRDETHYNWGTQAATWLVTTCARAADACFTLGGGGAIYESSPLQRRLRDLHAAEQHVIAHQRHYVKAGQLLLDGSATEEKSPDLFRRYGQVHGATLLH